MMDEPVGETEASAKARQRVGDAADDTEYAGNAISYPDHAEATPADETRSVRWSHDRVSFWRASYAAVIGGSIGRKYRVVVA